MVQSVTAKLVCGTNEILLVVEEVLSFLVDMRVEFFIIGMAFPFLHAS